MAVAEMNLGKRFRSLEERNAHLALAYAFAKTAIEQA